MDSHVQFPLPTAVSIVVAFLKRHGVRHLVLSPGMRNIPFVAAVDGDPRFVCHSVVDERNAAFYALGVAQACGEPVCLACTSGTAVSNYLTGLTEAYQSRTPLVALTCDRSPYVLGSLETQKIDQVAALRSAVKYSADLPVLKDRDDVWYFERVLNEAFIALRAHAPGPVHVNLPLVGDTNAMWSAESREAVGRRVKFIDYVAADDAAAWRDKARRLAGSRRVMVVLGQTFPRDRRLHEALARFANRFRCPVLADNLSNFRCPQLVPAEAVAKGLCGKTFAPFMPEIVITAGLNFQERIKDLFKANARRSEHWGVDPEGRVRDCFKSQTAVFECADAAFFERMLSAEGVAGSGDFLSEWRSLADAAELPAFGYGNLAAVAALMRHLPAESLLHVSVLNAIRLSQFFMLPPSVEVYANASAFGIDGCLPAFMGQAAVCGKPAFIVIGDVSFFYAMNALSVKGVGRNVHVFLVNNGGAAEFHIPPASHAIPTIDRCIGVAHGRTAKAWAEASGYEYLSASDEASLQSGVERFVRADNPRPVLFEVFTDMRTDGEATLRLYRDIEASMRRKGVLP